MDGVDVITLGDVADVFMTDNSADIYTNVNGEPGILLTMQKQTGYSTGEVSDKILARFDELLEQNENLMLITRRLTPSSPVLLTFCRRHLPTPVA